MSTSLASLKTVVAEGVDRADVSWRNIKAMNAFVEWWARRKRMRPDIAGLRLWSGLPSGWTPERLDEEWAPLPVFSIPLMNLARMLGNPSRLEEAGWIGGFLADWGLRTLATLFSFLRLIVPPRFMFELIIPKVMGLFNTVKLVVPYDIGNRDAVGHRTTYQINTRAGSRWRRPIDDVLSLLWWAPGMTAAASRLWRYRAKIVHHVVVLDLMECIRVLKEFIREEVVLEGRYIIVNGTVVAEEIRLYPERVGEAVYYTATSPTSGDAPVKGFRVTQDIGVTSPIDGEQWTLAKAGTIFSADSGCSITSYGCYPRNFIRSAYRVMEWVQSTKPFRWLQKRILEPAVREAEHTAVMEQQRIELQRANRLREQTNRWRFPDAETERLVEAGEFGLGTVTKALVVYVDLEGSTGLHAAIGTARMNELEVAVLGELFGRILAAYHYSSREEGTPSAARINETGDGFVFLLRDAPLARLVEVALRICEEIHDVAGTMAEAMELSIRYRCGLAFGAELSVSCVPSAPSDLKWRGEAIDQASRYQDAGKDPALATTEGRGITILPNELAQLVEDKARFHRPSDAVELKGLGGVRLVRFEGWGVPALPAAEGARGHLRLVK